jgi:hypothetical protein
MGAEMTESKVVVDPRERVEQVLAELHTAVEDLPLTGAAREQVRGAVLACGDLIRAVVAHRDQEVGT